jgi:hypothetical protein
LSLLLAVPAVWLVVVWVLAVPAAVLTNVSAEAALGSSSELTQGNWWLTAGLLAAGTVTAYALTWLFSLSSGLLIGLVYYLLSSASSEQIIQLSHTVAFAGVVVRAVSLLTVWPVVALGLVFYYLSLTERKHGVGLKLLAQRLGQPPIAQQ